MANNTRGNSQLKMFHSILQVPSDAVDKLNFYGKLGAHEIRLIKICEILLPLEEASDQVQGDNIVTSSKAIIYASVVFAKNCLFLVKRTLA